jgi:hypothetical protein
MQGAFSVGDDHVFVSVMSSLKIIHFPPSDRAVMMRTEQMAGGAVCE